MAKVENRVRTGCNRSLFRILFENAHTSMKRSNEDIREAPPMRLYSMKEAAARWGITYWTLRAMVLDGRIRPIVNVGRGFKFDGTELASAKLERL